MLAPNRSIATAPDELPRQLPHNIEAEQALLGAILIDNRAHERVAEIVGAADFFDPVHGRIFEAVTSRIQSGRVADARTLADLFRDAVPINGSLTVPQYLGRLAVSATTIANARDYARTVHDLAIRREIIRLASNAIATAMDAALDIAPSVLLEETESAMFALAEYGERGGEVTFAQALDRALEAADEAFRRGTGLRGAPTGFVDLDRKMGGLAAGDLIILAGRPSMGKTALVTNIAYNVARRGAAVGFYSLEMPLDQIATRIIAQEANLSAEGLRRGTLGEDGVRRAMKAAQDIRDHKFVIDDRGGLSVGQLAARARRMKRRHGVELLVVDYLQLMTGGTRRDNRVQEITEITTGLKALAKELNVPIIALSQLSRQVEQRPDKRPQLSDLRDSGSIEQDADIVLLVYREEYYLQREKPDPSKIAEWEAKFTAAEGKAEVIIGKHRHGEVGTVEMAWLGDRALFSDLHKGARR